MIQRFPNTSESLAFARMWTPVRQCRGGLGCTISSGCKATYLMVRLSKRANALLLGCTERYTCRRVRHAGSLVQIRTPLREWWNFGPIRIVLIITLCHVVSSDSIRSRTQGGIFTTPGDAYTTPVDMWVKALGEHFFFLRGT